MPVVPPVHGTWTAPPRSGRQGASATRRVESLDYLRGVMAFSVMLYHYFGGPYEEAQYTLGKLGIYAVSTFYILSGLSLAIAYRHRLNDGNDVVAYMIRRIFRIFPALWVATSATVALGLLSQYLNGTSHEMSAVRLALNYSLLFGFVRPDAYIATGSWSIGNEIVFYFIFPLMVLSACRRRKGMIVVSALSLALYVYFCFFTLHPSQPLHAQWRAYINPLNQAFLFAAGVVIGSMAVPKKGRFVFVTLFILAGGLFVLYPARGNQIVIVTGWNRLALTFLCIAGVACLYWSELSFHNRLGRCLRVLGESSYSIYLLHPIIAIPVIWITRRMGLPAWATYAFLCIPLTVAASWLSYRKLEKPMMGVGARVSTAVVECVGRPA